MDACVPGILPPRDAVCLGAKPRITGLWQVKRRSDTVAFEEVIKLDMQYIREYSLWLDAKILLLTLPAVIRGRGHV